MNLRIILLLALFAGCSAAQDPVTVPLSNPSQPPTIKASVISGSITVTTGAGSQVIVESSASERDRHGRNERDNPPQGMHRIDAGGPGTDIDEDHNVVTIRTRPERGGNLVIQAPANSSLELRTVNGGTIDVTGINGDIEVENTNGSINLNRVSGSVVAHTLNGRITADIQRVTDGKPMSFTSLNGKIDVTLPAATKARLRLKSDHGAIYSDFDVKMEPDASRPVVEDNRNSGGKYRIRMDHAVYGSINGGGPEFLFQTLNGDILIHKK